MADPIKVLNELIKAETDLGNYINSSGGNPFETWYKGKFRQRCDEFANLPPWARALGGPASGSLARICTPYWNAQGVDGPVNPGPPFTGGQCVGVNYLVVIAGPDGGVGPGTAQRIGQGPVVGVIGGAIDFGFQQIGVQFADGPQFGGGGQGSINPSDLGAWQVVSVTRQDEFPDDCGNPPNAPLRPGPNPPPNPGPQPGPEPRDNPTGNPIPIVPIPPYDDPTYGPQPYDPGDDGDGDGGGGGGGGPATQPPFSPPGGGGDGMPGDPDAVGEPAGETGAGGDGEGFDFGPPPAGKVWVGVLIENTVDERYGNIPGTGPQNTVYPYVIGNASLRYTGGRSGSSRMRSRWHELFRPVTALEVIGCFVQCRPGVFATVRPVSATICSENPCGDDEDG